jgi:flagellar basal-body rod protein FlgC
MNLITALDVNATGLTAQRKRVEVASSNLANTQTTRTMEGGPYRRKDVVFQTTTSFNDSLKESIGAAMDGGVAGVEVSDVVEDSRPFDSRYEPGHPDADSQGYVNYPNVNAMEEMANLVEASRSYEANLAAINIVKAMITRTLEIGR